MKKKYLQPTTKLTIVNGNITLLAGSTTSGGGSKGTYSGDGQLSRQAGMWDDDDDIED